MSSVRAPMAQVDYPAMLDAAWQQHLAPRTADAPTVISLFAGCGGSSLGYSMAGYQELLAVEWDNNAVETFKLNFPGVPVYHGDICKLSVEECMALAGLTEPGQLDVLDGSPPCQGFSTAGKRNLDDARNSLFREFVRLLRGLQPKAFVMENVSGLVKGKMKLVFAEIMRELKASGYQVSCRLMNAMWFGVPQSRERLIWVGIRQDLGIVPGHPEAEHQPITVREAILQDGLSAYRHSFSKGSTHVRYETFDKPSMTLRKVIAGGQHLISTQAETAIAQDQPAPPLTPLYVRYWNDAQNGKAVGKINSNKKLRQDATSYTIARAEGNGGLYHSLQARGLSTGERKRIASFPDAFRFTDWKSAVERIGNSVPPLFMRAIALHVRGLLEPALTHGAVSD